MSIRQPRNAVGTTASELVNFSCPALFRRTSPVSSLRANPTKHDAYGGFLLDSVVQGISPSEDDSDEEFMDIVVCVRGVFGIVCRHHDRTATACGDRRTRHRDRITESAPRRQHRNHRYPARRADGCARTVSHRRCLARYIHHSRHATRLRGGITTGHRSPAQKTRPLISCCSPPR